MYLHSSFPKRRRHIDPDVLVALGIAIVIGIAIFLLWR